jgi:hypothetical protein
MALCNMQGDVNLRQSDTMHLTAFGLSVFARSSVGRKDVASFRQPRLMQNARRGFSDKWRHKEPEGIQIPKE